MVRIVTDSTSDLPRDLAREMGIEIVPLRVIFGEETFLDGIDLSSEAFFRRLASSPTLPTTSQPPPGDFQRVFEEIVQAGDEVVCVVISSVLSGTYASAMTAKEAMGEAPISVVDSRTTSMALGLLAQEAARMARAGATRVQIVEHLKRLVPLTHIFFVVDTLEYLQKGGRIGGAQALVGTLLNIKPLLTLQEGRVEPLERIRSKRRALARMVEIAAHRAQATGHVYRAAALHSRSPEEAALLAQQIRERIRCEGEVYQGEIGPVLGTHVGPGVVGMAMMPVLSGE